MQMNSHKSNWVNIGCKICISGVLSFWDKYGLNSRTLELESKQVIFYRHCLEFSAAGGVLCPVAYSPLRNGCTCRKGADIVAESGLFGFEGDLGNGTSCRLLPFLLRAGCGEECCPGGLWDTLAAGSLEESIEVLDDFRVEMTFVNILAELCGIYIGGNILVFRNRHHL